MISHQEELFLETTEAIQARLILCDKLAKARPYNVVPSYVVYRVQMVYVLQCKNGSQPRSRTT